MSNVGITKETANHIELVLSLKRAYDAAQTFYEERVRMRMKNPDDPKYIARQRKAEQERDAAHKAWIDARARKT